MIALDGTPLYETEPYIAFKQTLAWLDRFVDGGLEAQTTASVVSGAMQSYRFGGRFFFYSPIGLFHFASPIVTNGRHSVTAVGGPILMLPLEEYISFDLEGKLPEGFDRGELAQKLSAIPVFTPDVANTLAEQLLINVKHLSDPSYLGIADEEGRHSEYLLAWFSGIPSSYEAILNLAAEQQREKAAKKHERVIDAVKKYIEQNYSGKITLDDVARNVYLSPSYLSKIIKLRTDQSFRHLVNMTRITEAVRLLEHTDKSLSEIAFQTGFEDHSYFTKVFKRHTKMNPSEYRRKHRS